LHPLLGHHIESARSVGEHIWEVEIDRQSLHYLSDHQVQGVAVLPAAAFVEMALTACATIFGARPYMLTELELLKMLPLPEGHAQAVQVSVSLNGNGEASFDIHSRPANRTQASSPWALHARGKFAQLKSRPKR
jgi:acyl transferase domain-containing protein